MIVIFFQPVEEKPTSQKENKKKESTINRKKHKQSSSPKPAVEKTDSLTLKTMDINFGEEESAKSEPVPEPEPVDESEVVDKVEPSPAVEGPVDYGSMTRREKRRARGQLRMDEIAKSKKEIDAKQAKVEDEVFNGGDDNSVAENEPAMDVDETAPADEKPAESQTVTSTMHIERNPVTKTPSGGILKKSKGGRIPSTEDHYFVTLNAALLQQDDAFYHSGLQPTRQHGILKHTPSAPPAIHGNANSSEANTNPSEDVPTVFDDVSNVSDDVPKSNEDVPKPLENKKVSEFMTVVQVNSGENVSKDDNPGTSLLDLQDDKETGTEEKQKVIKNNSKPCDQNTEAKSATKEATTVLKKPLAKTDNTPQQRTFTPPPWQRKSSRENMKPSPQPLQGVSKVSLKANRFLSNDKSCTPKSPTNSGPMKTSKVLGKSKLFQKDTIQSDTKKTSATTTELKNVACDISLDDSPTKNEPVEISTSKARADSHSKVASDSGSKSRSNSQLKVLSDGQNKSRSDSFSKTRSGSKCDDEENADQESKLGVNASRSRSNSTQKNENEEKTINGQNAKESKNEESGNEVKEDLSSSSTHSLTEVTIRPRGNSGEEQAGGFDIMLTIAPPTDQSMPESRPVSTMKTRFTSSSSSLPDPRSGIPNGKLTSLSTNDMTSLSREPVTSPTGDRHSAAQGAKYTPQRDFSMYLNSDSSKSVKTTGVPANTQKPAWQVKRNTPATVATTPSKTIVTPKSPTSPTTRPSSLVAKNAAAKFSVAMPKGKKSAITTTAYIPRRSFGFSNKTANQSEETVKPSETEEAPKINNNNDETKRLSQSSYTSDRSGSSASSDDMSLSNVTAENNKLNRAGSNERILVQNTENHSGNLSPRASPVLQKKWKATLVLPKESEKVPSGKDRDIRISSKNAPRKNKFSNARSMFEGK